MLEVSHFLLVDREEQQSLAPPPGCFTPDSRDSASCAERNHRHDRATGISVLPSHLQIIIKAPMGENGYFLVQNYLVMTINPSWATEKTHQESNFSYLCSD